MIIVNRMKTTAIAALMVAAAPAFAAPSIESLADDLAAKPAAGCTDKLPDGTCADQPSARQMVIPGTKGVGAVTHHAVVTATKAIRRDISMTFLVGSADLTTGAKTTLDRFAARLVQVASYRPFTVEGHTDRSGPADKNLALSQARADSVVTYLSAKGVDKTKMTATGFGFDKPLPGVAATSPRNRRVEVVAN